jgi:UDP-N-acetylglucosamine transferase subunit ALG13
MARLIVELDRLVASGELEDEVIITAAGYGQRPALARGLGIQPFDVLTDLARTATAIVTHGGPASIALALSAGHSPVVVPRNPAWREHVDDHQLRFAAWLAERRNITVVLEMDRLGDAIREALTRRADRPLNPPVPVEAITRLRSILASGG